MKPFYVSTPIYYVNDAPHIGHAYSTLIADSLSRYQKLFGGETYFLTGTDEHGQKVQKSAEARGLSPKEHCDEYVERFKDAWKALNITPDFFIRTTMDFHKQVVSDALQELFDKGDIYKDEYEGWYSQSEEMFFSEDELVDGKSPLGKEVVKIKESNYFFKMSAYHERLKKHLEDNPEFIQPPGKRSEVLGLLSKSLGDLCISRPKQRLTWGIELPFDKDFVTYVWFDALLNYISALGYKSDDESNFEKFWPESTHIIGKDILMTHSLYWPTMLMALDISLPKRIFAHGWWLNDTSQKMSKSEGKVVNPLELKEEIGVWPIRYFLLRGMSLGRDGVFSKELLIQRVNAELANNLGNLLSRSAGLAGKYLESQIPVADLKLNESRELASLTEETVSRVIDYVQDVNFGRAVDSLMELLSETNRYIDGIAPWKLLKETEGKSAEAAESLYVALEVVRVCSVLLGPIVPDKMAELRSWLGLSSRVDFEEERKFSFFKKGDRVEKGSPLFPRLEGE